MRGGSPVLPTARLRGRVPGHFHYPQHVGAGPSGSDGSRAATAAMAVYPEAHMDIEGNGLALYPSAPAVPKAEARRLGIE